MQSKRSESSQCKKVTPFQAEHVILVFIVSKQEWVSQSLESILAPHGYAVEKAFTRAETLSRIQREAPDAVIVDELPEVSGLDFCRELRESHAITPSTPILLTLSSPATRRDRLEAWRAGAWACLGDPLDAEELLAVLDAFLPAKIDADQARNTSLLDESTGVYNARGITQRARELAAQAFRVHAPLGCVLLAPEFGNGLVNGSRQERLQHIAATLKAVARTSDAIGRIGPNAFIILAVNTNAEQAHRVAERLGAAVLNTQSPEESNGHGFKLFGGCYGVADFQAASIDESELMLRATAALDRARADSTGSWLRDFKDET